MWKSDSDSDSDSELRRHQEITREFRKDEQLYWIKRQSSYVGEAFEARHLREREATTKEEEQSCQAIHNVLKKMIQLPESKQICGDHDVDHEFLTEVLENLENCVTQLTLIRLAKAKAKRDQLAKRAKRDRQLKLEIEKKAYEERKQKLTSADDDEIPASKKTRYSPDGEETLVSKKI